MSQNDGFGRQHPGLSAKGGLVLLVAVLLFAFVWNAAVDQGDLPESPNSEVTQ